MFRYLTAGESHGKGLTLIIDGLPAGVAIDLERLNRDLARRQRGYGRSERQKIEKDQALVFSGLRFGETIGAPITLHIPNRDWQNHRRTMSTEPLLPGNSPPKKMTVPRPGHADLAGWYKYGRRDLRDIWEQSSARDTAAHTAAGAVARQVLEHFGVKVASHTIRVGKAAVEDPDAVTMEMVKAIPSRSSFRCADSFLEKAMEAQVDRAGNNGDTLGGAFQVLAGGVCPGLGRISHAGLGLDARLSSALMSIPSVKGVEVGFGVRGILAGLSGRHFHDPIQRKDGQRAISRGSNRAGGIEGGLTNGELIRVTAYVKPISTLGQPLDSIDLQSGKKGPSESPRSDVCILPAAGVVGEAVVLLALLELYLETFGGDTLEEMVAAHQAHLKKIEERLPPAAKVTVVPPREETVVAEPFVKLEQEAKPAELEAEPEPVAVEPETEPKPEAVEPQREEPDPEPAVNEPPGQEPEAKPVVEPQQPIEPPAAGEPVQAPSTQAVQTSETAESPAVVEPVEEQPEPAVQPPELSEPPETVDPVRAQPTPAAQAPESTESTAAVEPLEAQPTSAVQPSESVDQPKEAEAEAEVPAEEPAKKEPSPEPDSPPGGTAG